MLLPYFSVVVMKLALEVYMKKFFLCAVIVTVLATSPIVFADPFAYVGERYHATVGDGWDEPRREVDGFYLFDMDQLQSIESTSLPEPFVSALWAGIALKADGTRLYLGDVLGHIGIIDTLSNSLTATVALDGRLSIARIFLSQDGERLYAHGASGDVRHDHIFQIDTLTNQVVRQVDLGGELELGRVYSVAYDSYNDLFYCFHEGSPASFSVLQSDLTLDHTTPLALPLHFDTPYSIAINPDGLRIFTSFASSLDDQASFVAVASTQTGEILHRIPIEGNGQFLHLNNSGNRLIAFDFYGIMNVIDTESGQTLFVRNIDRSFTGAIDISQDDKKMLLGFIHPPNNNGGGLFLFDLESWAQEEVIIRGQPWGVVFDDSSSGSRYADLSVSLQGSPEVVCAGCRLTYTATINNRGRGMARNVRASLTIPPRFRFVPGEEIQIISSPEMGNRCQWGERIVTCNGFDISRGRDVIIRTVVVTPRLNNAIESFDATAQIQSIGSVDPNPNNNEVVFRTQVQENNSGLVRSLRRNVRMPVFRWNSPQGFQRR